MAERSVLIVDDEIQVGETLRTLFNQAGFKALYATTYEAGLEAMHTKPDIAVVDVGLSERSGIDFIKEVQAGPQPHPFFVVLTNSINPETVADAMDANVTMFLQKADHDAADIVKKVAEQYGATEH